MTMACNAHMQMQTEANFFTGARIFLGSTSPVCTETELAIEIIARVYVHKWSRWIPKFRSGEILYSFKLNGGMTDRYVHN